MPQRIGASDKGGVVDLNGHRRNCADRLDHWLQGQRKQIRRQRIALPHASGRLQWLCCVAESQAVEIRNTSLAEGLIRLQSTYLALNTVDLWMSCALNQWLSEEANRVARTLMITRCEQQCCHEQYYCLSASATLAYSRLATMATFL